MDQPVYATCDYTWDMGKTNGVSAKKKNEPELKMLVRCYRGLKTDKPGVIMQTAVEKSLLVDCLKPFMNEWAKKLKENFEVEHEG